MVCDDCMYYFGVSLFDVIDSIIISGQKKVGKVATQDVWKGR
jgi:hypothetical protein